MDAKASSSFRAFGDREFANEVPECRHPSPIDPSAQMILAERHDELRLRLALRGGTIVADEELLPRSRTHSVFAPCCYSRRKHLRHSSKMGTLPRKVMCWLDRHPYQNRPESFLHKIIH
jgi:hypothetical protein